MTNAEEVILEHLRGAMPADALLAHCQRSFADNPESREEWRAVLAERLAHGDMDPKLLDRLREMVGMDEREPMRDGATRLRPPTTGSGEVQAGEPVSGSQASSPAEQPEYVRSQESSNVRVLDGRYFLESRLGGGGMGDVYRARDRLMEEAQDPDPYIALKVIGEAIREYPEASMALQREGRRTQSLSHPNIVKVFHFGHDAAEDTYYLTMELLHGQTFKEILKNNRAGLSFRKAAPLIEQLCAGISYAHSKGIVHSDIKPGNILLTDDYVVKVLDFGIAMPLRAAGGRETRFNPRQMGALSPAHSSVEVWLGMDADQRDDVYSLGCVVYELLTGRHPFRGEEAPRAMERKLKIAPVKGLTRSQNAALCEALSFTRQQRSPSVEHFANKLLKGSRSPQFASPTLRGAIAGIAILGLVVVLWTWFRPAAEPDATQSVESPPPVVAPVEPLDTNGADLPSAADKRPVYEQESRASDFPSAESLPPKAITADECANLEARWDLLNCADRRACFEQRATVAETAILIAPPESVDIYMARGALNRVLSTMICESQAFERDRLYREFQTQFPGVPVN